MAFFEYQHRFGLESQRAIHDHPTDRADIQSYSAFIMSKAHQAGYQRGEKVFQRGIKALADTYPAPELNGSGKLKGKGFSFIRI